MVLTQIRVTGTVRKGRVSLPVKSMNQLYRPSTGGLNFVSTGGKALQDLREDVYDNARNSSKDYVDICGVYAIALSGGEPYAEWV